MDVKIVFIVVCYISQFFQTILASMVPMPFREVVGFCRNNGHKYLTIFDDGHAAENKKNILLVKQGKQARNFNHKLLAYVFCYSKNDGISNHH